MGLFATSSQRSRMVATLLALFSQFSSEVMAQRERSFIMIKPDGVHRGLVGEIISRFEKKGFKLVSMKHMWASEELLKQHYADLSERSFFSGLAKSAPGTIRGDYCIE